MSGFFSGLWDFLYYSGVTLFDFVIYQAWFILGLLLLLVTAKIMDRKKKAKKRKQNEDNMGSVNINEK